MQGLVCTVSRYVLRGAVMALSAISTPTVITVPGIYILANDIHGTITIDADNVVLILNHKKVTGGTQGVVINNCTNVIVTNGAIDQIGVRGITIKNATNVKVSGVDFNNSPTAIFIQESNSVTVQECTIRNQTAAGIYAETMQLSTIANSRFFKNIVDNVITLSGCSCVDVHDLSICDNQGGTALTGITFFACANCICSESIIAENENAICGIASKNSNGTLIDKVYVSYNNLSSHHNSLFEGISLQGDFRSCVKNCLVNDNTVQTHPQATAVAIAVRSGFFNHSLVQSQESLIEKNIVRFNTGTSNSIGFLHNSVENNNVFLCNEAQGHVENYAFFPASYPIATLQASLGIVNAGAMRYCDNISIIA